MKLKVANKFSPLFDFDKRFVYLRGGRVSGKTTVTSQMIIILTMSYPNHDVIVCRDSYSDLANSTYTELRAFISDNGLEKDFEFKVAPLYIHNKKTDSNIYFVGIGGSDKHRTKSFKPAHKLSAVLFEELQQVKDQENLEQAHASFRRHLDTEMGTLIHIYNPPSQNSHWTNVYWTLKQVDPDWLCINTDYRDIVNFINDVDLKEILKMKIADPMRYRWLYLGETGGGFGSVYPQFKRAKHFRPAKDILDKFANTKGLNLSDDAKRLRFGQSIQSIVIGGDGAVTHDATVMVALFLMNNGQIVVPEIFYHDPLKAGQKASAELLPFIQKWLKELETNYAISDNVPMIFSIDSASTELIRMVRYHLPDRYEVYAYGKQTILDMTGVVQSTLARNICYIMDTNGYFDYVQNQFAYAEHPLVVALENLVWNDSQTHYDPTVPNDASDAFTYGINQIFRNVNNLYALNVYNENRQDFYDLEVPEGY
jgi:PBSX family phage terminase large subunit